MGDLGLRRERQAVPGVDFELAAWGPAELDVTWLAEMDRMRTVGSNLAPLAGFLDDEEAVGCYEHHAGRRLAPNVLRWATTFNALKISVLMHRHLRVMVHEGRLPADHRILSDNVSTRRCRELLAVSPSRIAPAHRDVRYQP
jgi:hypothetical protein